MKIQNFKIGSDVEFFVQNENGEIISAEGLIQGTKYEPFHFDPDEKYFATSLDNVLAEGNIPPVENQMDWVRNMNKLRKYIDSQLPKGMCTVGLPAVRMDEQWLQTMNAKTFGCDPAYVAWTRSQKENPDCDTNLRTAGLHVHVSYDDANTETTEELIKALDLYLSIPALLIEPDNERKQNYGKAGEFRFCDYGGGEYRSLSAYFAENDRRLAWVYDNTLEAIKFVNDRFDIDEAVGEKIQHAINNNDKDVALELIHTYNIPVLAE